MNDRRVLKFSEVVGVYQSSPEYNSIPRFPGKQYRRWCIDNIRSSWPNLWERCLDEITPDDCVRWAQTLKGKTAGHYYSNTVWMLRRIFQIGIKENFQRFGVRLANPARCLKGKNHPNAEALDGVPVHEVWDYLPWPNEHFRRLTPAYILSRRILRRLRVHLLKHTEGTVRVYNYKMRVPLSVLGIGPWLASYGFREPDQRFILQQVLKPNDVILDLGANYGYYVCMYLELLNKHCRVYAVEPDPRNLPFLHANVTLNGLDQIVTIDPIALSDGAGTRDFKLAERTNHNSLQVSSERKYVAKVPVTVRDFGEYLSSLNPKANVVRMDIEGHESFIFSSLVKLLRDDSSAGFLPETIIFEPHHWEYSTPDAIAPTLRELTAHGYSARFVSVADERISPLRPFGYKASRIFRAPGRYGKRYGLYERIAPEHAVDVISDKPGVTTVCLSRAAH